MHLQCFEMSSFTIHHGTFQYLGHVRIFLMSFLGFILCMQIAYFVAAGANVNILEYFRNSQFLWSLWPNWSWNAMEHFLECDLVYSAQIYLVYYHSCCSWIGAEILPVHEWCTVFLQICIEDMTRWRRDMSVVSKWWKQYALVHKILFSPQESKIHLFKPPCDSGKWCHRYPHLWGICHSDPRCSTSFMHMLFSAGWGMK